MDILLCHRYSNPPQSRLVTFFIAIYWVCMHDTSGITRVAVSVIAAISILLVAVILCNSDWKSQPSIYSIATKMKKMNGMVKRVPATTATRLRTLSRTLSESARWTLKSMPRVPRRRTTRTLVSDPATIMEEGAMHLELRETMPSSPPSVPDAQR